MASMGDVKIPLQFDELREDNGSGFNVSDMMDEDSACEGDFAEIINDFAMAVESEVELEQRHVDAMFNAVACFKALSPEQRSDFAGSLIGMCSQKMENLSEQSTTKSKNDFKMTHYFLHALAAKAELYAPKAGDADGAEKKAAGKGKKKAAAQDSFQWADWRPAVLQLFQRALAVDPSVVWFMGIPEEAFLGGMWRWALQLLEERPPGVGGAGGAEAALRAQCGDVVLSCARQLAASSTSGDEMTTLCTAALDSICRSEHMGPVLAALCHKENGRFAAQLMAEIGTMNLTDLGKSGTGVKNVGSFLVSMAETAPRLMAQFLPSFIHLLDSEVYQIRSCIIQVMGAVVSYTHEVCARAASAEPAADSENAEREERNQEQLKRVRDSMMDMLVERTYDVSSFTRAAVLKTWAAVAEAGAIPLSRFEPVAEVAVDRLQDRTALVRKAAMALLVVLLENNPFGGVLAGEQFSAQEKELAQLLQARVERLAAELRGAAQSADPARRRSLQVKRETEEEEEEEEAAPEDDEEEQVEISEDAEVVSLRNAIQYCSAAARFIAAVELSVPRVAQMLASKTVSDVVEALRFVARAVKFGVGPCAALLQSSFALVWHQEEAITKECLASFVSVYLTDGAVGSEPQLLPDDLIAANLVGVCVRCGASELASVEKIVGLLFAEKVIDAKAVGALWTMVNTLSAAALVGRAEGEAASPEASLAARDLAGALRVVAMAARFCPSMLSPSRLNAVLGILLHPAVKHNMLFPVVLSAAQCLQAVPDELSPAAPADSDGSAAATRALLLDATEGICTLLVGDFVQEDSEHSRQWFGAAEELLHAVFHTHPSPDLVLARLVAVLYDRVFTAGAAPAPAGEGGAAAFQCSSGRLSRLLFALGQGAICSLVYAERVAGLAKRARERKALAEKEAAYSLAQRGGAPEPEREEADSMEQEMGMAAATDAEHEQNFNRVIEVDLVCNEQNILGKFHQMIAFIVADEKGHFGEPALRENALLALCRYMTVSSHMCDTYLPLLFTSLERETSESNKTTIMIALGDLAFRFPNSLEPWIGYMYARLSDPSLLVRYNTLMVLTHLILNDMIKVKGQVSHVVMCLNDPSERVCGLAALFFSELSKRSNNPVYNLLGDVISFLSREEGSIASLAAEAAGAPAHRRLSQAEFQSTMTFLLSFVKKDKQADSLLERLVVRMGVTAGQAQRRDLAFCISLLPITDKGVKKMTELMRHIKDSLTDDVISECFKTCISRVKKTFVKGVAGEVNAVLEEFEAAVAAVRGESELLQQETEPGAEGGSAEQGPRAEEERPRKSAAKSGKAKAKAKPSRRRAAVSSDESDGQESDGASEEEAELSFSEEPSGPAKRGQASSSRQPLKEIANRKVR